MSDSNHDDPNMESGADSSASDVQNKSPQLFPSNDVAPEDLNMELFDSRDLESHNNEVDLFRSDEEEVKSGKEETAVDEPSLEEQLGLIMEDEELNSFLNSDDENVKTEQSPLDVKMEDEYSESKEKVEDSGSDKEAHNSQKEEKELVGLFEDSDDFENVDSLKSKMSPYLMGQDDSQTTLDQDKKDQSDKQLEKFEEQEILSTTLTVVPKPLLDEKLAICRFPPTLSVLRENDVRNFLRSNPHLLEHPPTTNSLSMLCFRQVNVKNTASGKNTDSTNFSNDTNDPTHMTITSSDPSHLPNSTVSYLTLDGADNPNKVNDLNNFHSDSDSREADDTRWESNGKVVLWEDGSVSMFVGTVPLDCESVKEISFLLEDGRADLKPVHAQVQMRLQTRFSNLHTRFSNLKNDTIKKQSHKRQKMEVASLSDAIQSHHALQQNLINIRETERQKKLSYNSKGLTRSFLESSDNEDDLL